MEFTQEEKKQFKEAKHFVALPYGTYKGTLNRVEAGEYGKNKEKKLLFKLIVTEPKDHESFVHTFFVPLTKVPWVLKKIIILFDIDEKIELEDVEKALIMKEGSSVLFKFYQNSKGYDTTEIIETISKNGSIKKPEIKPADPIDIDDDIPF